MNLLSTRELKSKIEGEVNDDLRKLFASQYNIHEHRKLKKKKKNHSLDEKDLSEKYEIIFKHFQDYCSEGQASMMQRRFGPEPLAKGIKRNFWIKKRDELALFMIRVYSGVEDREKLKIEVAKWIIDTENELKKFR